MKKIQIFLILFFILFFDQSLFSQTTGKISGKVIDGESKTLLLGANVILLPTQSGISTDDKGLFNLINVRPGNYSIKVMMIGYETVIIEDVIVSVNRTTSLDIKMNQTTLEGQEVVIYATKFSRKKDQTGTVKNISSDEIDILPVEDLGAVVNMQAGVVAVHFRGGRNNEVSYLIDGVPVNDIYGGVSSVSNLEVDAVEDLEVIMGTFNAEYGNAMSGVVNAVTKDGNNKFEASINTGLSTYLTKNKRNGEKIYPGLDPFGINSNTDFKFNFSGPLIKDKVFFFSNYRTQDINGHLNGIRNICDLSNFYDQDSSYGIENTGDSTYVPMGDYNSDGKVSINLGKLICQSCKIEIIPLISYNHAYKYNPDGRSFSEGKTILTMFQLNHFLNEKNMI